MGAEFNQELWEERFDNIKSDISEVHGDIHEVKASVAYLSKTIIGIIIAIAGWTLVELYGQVATKAHAAVPTFQRANK